jgi:hypothetical protein
VSHHYGKEQRRAKIVAVAVIVLILAAAVPLVLDAGLRLSVAEALGIVPEHPTERLFGGDAAVRLVVLTEEVEVPGTRPSRLMTATYVVEDTGDAIVLHDLNADRVIALPIADADLVSAASDRSAVLVVDQGVQPQQAVLVTVATGEVRPLPPGEIDPGIPGDWAQDVYAGSPGCAAVSPDGDQIACIKGYPWILGDWQLSVFPYGRADQEDVLLRALGALPVLGWAADESALYYQNETGIWRVPLDGGPAAGAT